MRVRSVVFFIFAVVLIACSSRERVDDPLKHSRQLITQGHSSLYDNGAFEVPGTTIKLIPAGPSSLEFASELAGLRARQSFRLSVQHAREAIALAPEGTKKSITIAKGVHKSTKEIADDIRQFADVGVDLVSGSPKLSYHIVEGSLALSAYTGKEMFELGQYISEGSLELTSEISRRSSEASGELLRKTQASFSNRVDKSHESSSASFDQARGRFVQGYLAMPETMSKRGEKFARVTSFDHFRSSFQQSTAWREKASGYFTDITVDATSNYTARISESFSNAKEELTVNQQEIGITLASLKALRWVLQGVFWDGAVAPAAKIGYGTIGYLATNTVAFPVLFVGGQTVAAAEVAVGVTWNTGAAAYELIAPTGEAAIAGAIGVGKVVGGTAIAAGEFTLGAGAAGVSYIGGKVVAGATAVGGVTTGQTIKYVGAPLTTVGVATAGTLTGVVVGASTATAGSAMVVAGYAGSMATTVTGSVASGGIAVGGMTASAVASAGLTTYELTKAIVVPAGYELGAGIVVGYDTLAQLTAHSVLAASDAAYVVLSLEGPRWVLYAVKGNTNTGDELVPGAMVNLDAMQKEGEVLYRLPTSDAENTKAATDLLHELPVNVESDTQ